ncbi:MAG: hypothetical protein K2M16_03355, partial [Muribaculaceae bacterium]|nr:hypothetical protein [Muribaculaceae bacterium]
FRKTIENDLKGNSHAGQVWRFVWAGLTLGAAAAILILLFVPSRLSAKEILSKAFYAIRISNCIGMKVDIRTESRENFEHIIPNAGFVTHEIILQRNDSTTYWYVTKGERSAEKNHNGLYVWIAPFNIGWHYAGHDYDVLGYLNILLNPESVLQSELQSAMSESGTHYEIEKRKNEIILTAHSMPEGDFIHPYALNGSVKESENIRQYVLDPRNYHLKSSTVSMIIDGKAVEVLKMTDIDYNPKDKTLPSIPTDITFIEDTEATSPSGIPGLDARETASLFLKALSDWNTDILYKFLYPVEAEEVYRSTYEGSRLLALGRPFKSGINPHLVFVPYTLRLKGGYVRKMNLALSRYPGEAWLFDGGL